MRSFFTRAFYLLQEVAGVDRLASLLHAVSHQVVVRQYIPPNRDYSRKRAVVSFFVLTVSTFAFVCNFAKRD